MVEQKKYKTFEEFAKDRKIFERKEEMISACLKIDYKIFDYHKDKDEIKKLKYGFEERLNNPHIRKLGSAILYLLYQPGIILAKDCFGNESRLLTTEKQETIDLYDAYLALNGDYYSFDFNIKDFEENNNLNKLGINKQSDIDNLINAALDFSRVYKNKEIFEFRYDAEKILNKGLNKFKKKIKILV